MTDTQQAGLKYTRKNTTHGLLFINHSFIKSLKACQLLLYISCETVTETAPCVKKEYVMIYIAKSPCFYIQRFLYCLVIIFVQRHLNATTTGKYTFRRTGRQHIFVSHIQNLLWRHQISSNQLLLACCVGYL